MGNQNGKSEECGAWNLLPCHDLLRHDEHEWCECHPTIQICSDGLLIIHKSYDGREYDEEARHRGH